MDFSKVVPLGDFVIVKDLPFKEHCDEGVVLPEYRDDPSWKAEVIAIGQDCEWQFDGEVMVGDVVIVPIYEGEKLDIDGVRYRVFPASDILAVLIGWPAERGYYQ